MIAESNENTLSAQWVSEPATRAADDRHLASAGKLDQWNYAIDSLLAWLQDMVAISFEELEPISPDLLKSAIDFAQDARDTKIAPPPAHVGPTCDGGISFEWREGNMLTQIEVIAVGQAEATVVRSGKVLDHFTLRRHPLDRGWCRDRSLQ